MGILIPVEKDGSVPHYADGDTYTDWSSGKRVERKLAWRAPWEFTDTFRITGMSRGRSAAYFNLQSETTDATCAMFMKDMVCLITQHSVIKGVIAGRWIFVKRGQNYGIRYLGPIDEGQHER